MQTQANFVNTSRAELVNTDALIEAFHNNLLSGIGVDVVDDEYSKDIEVINSALVKLAAMEPTL